MRVDDHLHAYRGEHPKREMRRYVRQAIRRGFGEICFAEHCPLPPWMNSRRMSESQLGDYVACAQSVRKEFPQVIVKCGIELDYHPDAEDFLKSIIEQHPFDFVLGAVHIHTPAYSSMIQNKPFNQVVDMALALNLAAAKTGLFDAIAHLDFCRWLCDPVRFGAFPGAYDPEQHRDPIMELLQVMETGNTCLEVNSSGLLKSFAEVLPSPAILKWAAALDLRYTFGSDAHGVEHVGAGYDTAMALLQPSQRRRMVTFRRRKQCAYEQPAQSGQQLGT